MADQPVMVLLAGPNGAGKSTLYNKFLRPEAQDQGIDLPFLNADDYARERWGAHAGPEVAYRAAQEIDRLRDQQFAARESFATETVFSHPSKLELLVHARKQGFITYLEVVVVPVEVSIGRVAQRVAQGGHDVPEDKIRSRYGRTDALLAQAIPLADAARIWQNAGQDLGNAPEDRFNHELVAKFRRGQVVTRRPTPDWMPPELTKFIKKSVSATDPELRRSAPGKPRPTA